MSGYFSNSDFNRLTNLDGIEWKIITALVRSKNKYTSMLWKMLRYPTLGCLFEKDLTDKEKFAMVYNGNGDASSYKVFLMPFIDDSWTTQSARLDIYVDRITPENRINSKVDIAFEIIVHNKINNIDGEASDITEWTNPGDLDENGDQIVYVKSRATTMLKCLVASLNGLFVDGVGELQFNANVSPYDNAKSYVWNDRSYFGYTVKFSTNMSGVSDSPNIGY